MSHNSDVSANALYTALLVGTDFELPEIDLDSDQYKFPDTSFLNEAQTKLTNSDLTERKVDGGGTFDFIMSGYAAHLKNEYESNRISGAEYTKAYVALGQAAMSGAVQFLLGRDAATWQAVLAQTQAITAQVQLKTALMQLAQAKVAAQNEAANFALTKLKLATEDTNVATAEYQLASILPQQLLLLKEQTNAALAQTSDTRSDGSAVAGSVGKQKELYTQQISSYQRSSELNVAKLYSDAWTVQKTVDEGLEAPDNFTNTSVDSVLDILKTNVGLA